MEVFLHALKKPDWLVVVVERRWRQEGFICG